LQPRVVTGVSGTFGILETIGDTPLIKVNGVAAKLEATNPTGSIKDRLALFLVKKAEERGELQPNDRILEVTSGNTGVSLALVAAVKNYRFTAVMPESASRKKREMMRSYGANLVLSSQEEGMRGAVDKYNQLIEEKSHYWLPQQFSNPDNLEAHRRGTGREILQQVEQVPDAFVAGIGTGGTLLGVAKALKQVNPELEIIGVEPKESAVLNGDKAGEHEIEGIGEGFVPELVNNNRELIDQVIKINSQAAITASKQLAKEKGLLVGISSGANYLAAQRLKKKYKRVVTVFPDEGGRYL